MKIQVTSTTAAPFSNHGEIEIEIETETETETDDDIVTPSASALVTEPVPVVPQLR